MKSLEKHLTNLFESAFLKQNLPKELGEVLPSTQKEFGWFQCNGCLAGAKQVQTSPRELAQKIIETTTNENQNIFEKLEIAGPGFINITLTQDFLNQYTNQAFEDQTFGIEKTETPSTIFVDYGGPNVAKPMHVGHLRSSIIGNTIYRLYKAKGYKTVSDIHLGDWGTQMGMIICELQIKNPSLPYFDPSFEGAYPSESPVTLQDLEEIYPQASSRCKSDPEALAEALKATSSLQNGNPGYTALWKHFVKISVDGLKKDYQDLGIDFDLWHGESNCHDLIPEMLNDLNNKQLLIESNGAKVIFFDPKELKLTAEEVPPLLLVKSDGAYLYGTTDLATLYGRINEYSPTKIIYVADARQSLHFKEFFCAYQKAHPEKAPHMELLHIGFGTVNGIDGKPFKTRAGGVMKLRDLIDSSIEKASNKMLEEGIGKEYTEAERTDIAKKVGIAALKYADLVNNRNSEYIFDLDRFISFNGKTGPYLIYSAVRIKSIFRKNNISETNNTDEFNISMSSELENSLALSLLRMPSVIDYALETHLPHILAEYLFELAQQFNRFYQGCNILNETDQKKKESWLGLCQMVLRQLETGLDLLGIEVPERM